MKSQASCTFKAFRLAVIIFVSLGLLACSVLQGIVSGGGAVATTEPETSQQAGQPAGIGRWSLVSEIPRGYAGPLNERFFTSAIEVRRVDSTGAEFLVNMHPVVDDGCGQTFQVGWEFERDIGVLLEGDTFNVTVFNQPLGDPQGGVRDCYIEAKQAMTYGGEVVIELKSSGLSHFLTQEGYKRYHEGDSQYLFVVTDPTRIVYPVGPISPVGSSTGTILVKNGVYEVGEFNAPHGNFSFTISAGQVFSYTVTYLYDGDVDP